MKKFKFNILAVKLNSLSRRNHTVKVEAENEEEAKLKLYETHEHIFIYSINGVKYSYL